MLHILQSIIAFCIKGILKCKRESALAENAILITEVVLQCWFFRALLNITGQLLKLTLLLKWTRAEIDEQR